MFLQVFCLALFFSYFCATKNNDHDIAGYIDNDDDIRLIKEKDDFYPSKVCLFSHDNMFHNNVSHIGEWFLR